MATDTFSGSTLKLINDHFWYLESRVGIRIPDNLYQEKVKFFNSGYRYNPQFTYPAIREMSFDEQVLENIFKIENQDIRKLYVDKLKEYKLRYELAQALEKSVQDFTKLSVKLYGKPSKQSLRAAHKIASIMPPINFDRKNVDIIRFRRLKKEIRNYITQNHLTGKIRVRHKQAVANYVSVSKRSGRVNVSDNYVADRDELVDIIYHELETHMRRLENGAYQEYGIFKIGTAGYLTCEEGLAPITGHVFKKNQLLWHPALLILAIDAALQDDFCSVFDTINSIIKEPFQSWTYAVRAKNGLADTGIAGAHTKDLYLKWAINASKELINNPDLLKYAYNGKASFSQLKRFTRTPDNFRPKITVKDISQLAEVNHFEI